MAETPELPIPRGSAGPGMLADTIVKRWQDHLPLHRHGGDLPARGNRAEPLDHLWLAHASWRSWSTRCIGAMHADALAQPYVCVDATGVLVQDRERCRNGHFWVLVAPPQARALPILATARRRSRRPPAAGLPWHRGRRRAHGLRPHLRDRIRRPRRGAGATCASTSLTRCGSIPSWCANRSGVIQTLFVIERGIKRAPPPEREKIRREKSAPVVEAFFAWCGRHQEHALDESPLHMRDPLRDEPARGARAIRRRRAPADAQQPRLCRARHKRCYAASRIMPRRGAPSMRRFVGGVYRRGIVLSALRLAMTPKKERRHVQGKFTGSESTVADGLDGSRARVRRDARDDGLRRDDAAREARVIARFVRWARSARLAIADLDEACVRRVPGASSPPRPPQDGWRHRAAVP